MKHLHSFARRAAAFLLAAVLCVCIPAAAASAATTIGGADTTLIPAEDENCLSWLFGSKDKITMPYLNIKGQGLKRNVTLDLEDCLVGITYTELGSIGSFVSASAAQQAWKAQAVAVHSYLEYHKQYGSSTNALIYTPVDQIPSSARNAIRKAVQSVKDEVLVYNGSVCDAVWSASAGYNTQTGVYGTCASLDAWGTDVPYLQSVESPYEEQYHKLLRRVIGKDYTYIEYNDSRTGEQFSSFKILSHWRFFCRNAFQNLKQNLPVAFFRDLPFSADDHAVCADVRKDLSDICGNHIVPSANKRAGFRHMM